MWPFNRKRGEEEQRTLQAIQGFWPDYAEPSMALGHVSVSRALALVPVFAATRLIADSIASLPPILYSNDSNGIPRRQPTPSLFANPSIHGTLPDWLHRGVSSQALTGDAIGLVTNRDYYGYPTMVEWLNPEQIATQDGKLYGAGSFMNPIWWWYGRPIDPKELVHIPWFTMPYRVRGLSPIGAYQLTANVGIGAQEFAANWYQNGGVPPGTFQNSERIIDPNDATEISNRLTSRMQSRKPLVYGRDWVYNPIAIKPHEAEFIETMRLTATQIATIYGIPPEKIGGTTGNSLTYTTAEQNSLDFLTFSLRPWLVKWEAALTNLFPRGYYVKFDTAELQRVDAKTRAQIDALSLGGGANPPGWKFRNEVRASYDLPPLTSQQLQQMPPIQMQPTQPVQPSQSNNPQQQQLQQPSTNGQPMMRQRVNGSSSNGNSSNANQVLSGSTPAATKGQ